MGFSGNVEPSYIIPTCIGVNDAVGPSGAARRGSALEDLDFAIGHEALANASSQTVTWPIRHGQVENWDHMERYWQQCMFKCAARRCGCARVRPPCTRRAHTPAPPRQVPAVRPGGPLRAADGAAAERARGARAHAAAPPHARPQAPSGPLSRARPLPRARAPAQNREYTAEIMFESFNVAGLYIGVQAVLALAASLASKRSGGATLTGTVIDSGDGVTHVIPVADGFVIASSIKSVPIAGRDLTAFVQQLMRERGEPVPPESALEVARRVKEQHCYVCSDIAKEFAKHDREPGKYIRTVSGVRAATNAPWTAQVGYERFLAPEVRAAARGASGRAMWAGADAAGHCAARCMRCADLLPPRDLQQRL
jgi:hypothetical protein